MKRILSLVLAVIVLAGVMVFETSAATLIHSDDFNTGFAPRNWFVDDSCAFFWEKGENQTGCIIGYSDALVLQSRFLAPYNKRWDKFYTSFDVQIKADDDATEAGETPDTSVAIWYRDQADVENVPSAVYMFNINVQTGEAKLNKSVSYSYKDESGITKEHSIDEAIATGNINDKIEVGENAKWFKIGMRVDLGKIECYYNEQLIFSLEANENDEKIGGVALHNVDATVGTVTSPILFWNFGNWLAVDNFEVWSPDYNFVSVTYGDADGNGKVNLQDASAIMKFAAKWDVSVNADAADVDGNGKINLQDASAIMKFAAKWDVVLGPQA